MVNSDRSYIICHMMTTIDGKINSGIKSTDILGDYYNLYSKLEQTLKPDAWMCGRVTAEMFAEAVDTPLFKSNKKIDASNFSSSKNDSKYLLVVDTKGLLRWKSNTVTFGDQSIHQLVIVVTQKTPNEYLIYLQEKDISYIVSGEDELDFTELFKTLKKDFQINILALEGGGLLNGTVMAADLIDEISLLITPLILNKSDSSSVFERKVEEELNIKRYKLFAVKQMENDTIWLRYKK